MHNLLSPHHKISAAQACYFLATTAQYPRMQKRIVAREVRLLAYILLLGYRSVLAKPRRIRVDSAGGKQASPSYSEVEGWPGSCTTGGWVGSLGEDSRRTAHATNSTDANSLEVSPDRERLRYGSAGEKTTRNEYKKRASVGSRRAMYTCIHPPVRPATGRLPASWRRGWRFERPCGSVRGYGAAVYVQAPLHLHHDPPAPPWMHDVYPPPG